MNFEKDLSARYPLLILLRNFFVRFGLDRFFRLGDLFRELIALKIDPVMGIPVRREWFRLLKARVIKACPYIERWDECSLEEILLDLSPSDFNTRHYVISGDVAYLSMVNKRGGHALGDKFLSGIALAIKGLGSGDIMPGRLGGDEIAILVVGKDLGGMNDLCRGIREAVSTFRLEFGGRSVKAWIDIDFAELSDALKVFRSLVRHSLKRGKDLLPVDSRVSTLLNIFVQLADRRMEVGKIYVRIYEIVDLWDVDRGEYFRQIPHLRKSSGEMTDEDVGRFSAMKKECSGDLFDKEVLQWALRERKAESYLDQLIESRVRGDLTKEFGL